MSAPTRIALILDPLTALVSGGRHTLELSRELVRRGHELRAFGTPADWMDGGSTEDDQGPKVKLGASVQSFQPDAIVAYDALSPAAWLGARVARRRGVPLLLVESGSWGGQRSLQRVLWRVGETLWGRYVRRSATTVIALDPAARQRALARGFAEDAVEFVPHGVDLEQFRPGVPWEAVARHRIRGRILSCLAPLDMLEELELVISAFARTVGQRPDWSLVLAGEGSLSSRLRACTLRLGVAPRVHVVRVADASLAGLLSSSTLFAAVRDYGPRTLLDVSRALACGVPVIAADTPRASCLVQDGTTGLVARAGDLEAWCERLRYAAGSPERRKRWGHAARSLAEAQLGWPAVARRFEQLLARHQQPTSANGHRLPMESAAQAVRG